MSNRQLTRGTSQSLTVKGKELSNPFSTGGGGAHFEVHVQAAFAVLMLAGGYAPCLPAWPIKKIVLQGKRAGFDTDDLIVFSENPNDGRSAKLLVQVKHSLSITVGNAVFGEVIQAAWNDFTNPEIFRAGLDLIALVTGPLTRTDMGVRQLLEWARQSQDAKEFLTKVHLVRFSSKTKEEKLGVFRSQLKSANGGTDLTDEQLWRFLRSYNILGYDLDIQSGVTHSLLHSLIGQYSTDNVRGMWALAVEEVQWANQNAGTITVESLSNELGDYFKRRVIETIPVALVSQVPPPIAVDWSRKAFAPDLRIALLLGGWDDTKSGDKDIASQLARRDFTQWIESIREALQDPETPLALRNGVWTITRREEMWQQLGPRIFDDDLDAFQKATVSVLSERDPKFELPLDERFMASLRGKVLLRSRGLRKGVAETLALLGSRPGALTHSSLNKPEAAAALSVRQVLGGADSVLWGSLNDLLPLLAEAAPDEFLDATEKALQSDPTPFTRLFAEEGNGATGENYLSGLLWALETLAWDPDWLTRVAVILGELNLLDPGGNWANRPLNSLTNIFLPWLPQTTAPVDRRLIALRTLGREVPESAWRVLLSLLPWRGQLSFGSRRPTWRGTIPLDWPERPSTDEYREQIDQAAELLIDTAKDNPAKLAELIGRWQNLPPSADQPLLEHLGSDVVMSLPQADKLRVWTALEELVTQHRKYEGADWVMPPGRVDRIAAVGERLAPVAPALRYQPLFSERDLDLYEGMENLDQQAKALQERRQKALEEIAATGGLESVLTFAQSVESPWRVGITYALIASNDEERVILPALLEAERKLLAQFAGGFAWARFRSRGWPWVDEIDTSLWAPTEVAQFLAYLPFTSDTWTRAVRLLGGNESLYWTRASVNPYEAQSRLDIAADRLIEYGRPFEAIGCLHKMQLDGQPLDIAQVVRALLAAVDSSERARAMDVYEAVELIKALQTAAGMDLNALSRVEWAYLPLLGEHRQASPKFLARRLADDPGFFCEMIRLVFRSRKEAQPREELLEKAQEVAVNAYHLLSEWGTPPGMRQDGSYDADVLADWLDAVKAECAETGHLEVAMTMVGHVLTYVPPDPEGLWIHRSAAAALNAKDAGDMRDGFRVQLYNRVGWHRIDPTGKPELELAEKYRRQADEVEDAGYQRLAGTLRELADSYDREAERIITEHMHRDDDLD
jgi:hypothetical protein